MANGQTLREVCRDKRMPAESTVRGWALDREDFAAQYARARELLCAHWADEIIEIADAAAPISDSVNQARLRVETRKWILSKLLPRQFGDSLAVTGIDTKPAVLPIINLQINRVRSSEGDQT
jgi:hypothetical protein